MNSLRFASKIFLGSLLLSGFIVPVKGQPADLKLDHISPEQGLSQSTIYAIVQDSQGFMWFGTQDGLNRFDGYSISVFKHDASDSNSIADNSIWSLLNDRDGNLWIGTMRGGLERYDLAQNKFFHYPHRDGDQTSVSENNVISLFQDSNGEMWLGTLNKGLNRYNKSTGTFSRYSFEELNPYSLSNNTIWSITEDRNKNLWVATWSGLCRLQLPPNGEELKSPHFISYHHNPTIAGSLSNENIQTLYMDRYGTLWVGTWGGGLDRYNETTNSFSHFVHDAKNPKSLSSNLILSIHEDSKGMLWIGTGDAGLNAFNRITNTFTRYKSVPQNPNSLNNDIISKLYEDDSGILWIGTGAGGVNIYDWRKNRFTHYYDDLNNPNDMNGNDVWAILEDKDGELWVGTYGNGLNHFSRSRKEIRTYAHNPRDNHSLSNNNVLALCEAFDGSIWMGTEGGGLDRFDKSSKAFVSFRHDPNIPNSLSFDEITALCEDRNGDMWIGNKGGGIDRLRKRTSTFIHYRADEKDPAALAGTSVMVIYEDRRGIIWIGSLGGGVHRYIPGTNSFKRYEASTRQSSTLNNNTVLSIYEDTSGILWMGTYGGGLNRFDPTTESFTHFTEQDGLSNNVVYGILPDKAGNLWLSTNKGISRFNPANNQFRNYDLKDGLQGNEFNQGSYCASRNGELFFGGINGINAFFPDSIGENNFIPPVHLTNFKVFDKVVPISHMLATAKQIELSYAENFFSFEFVALNYTSPEKNRYAYMLEGLDRSWNSAPSRRRYASYTNLDPGHYVLRVRGSNNDGIWNEQGMSVGITITPPYWKTWWFRVLATVVIAAILFLLYRYRVNKLLEIERIRSSIAVDLHDDIGSTLTEIALFSDVGLRELHAKTNGRPEKANIPKIESLLQEIGTTSRGLVDAMNDIVWAVDPKNDSFEFLLLRMKTHAGRMLEAKGINYEIDIPEELSELHLPLSFRRRFYLIFKEAINNVIRHAQSTKVLLTIRREGQSLIMTIVDDGKGFNADLARDGNGLGNMKKRAGTLDGDLTIMSQQGKGTTVQLTAAIP